MLELRREAPGELERKPGLPDAADSGQRDQPGILPPEEVGESGKLALAAEEWSRRSRQPPLCRRPGLRSVQRRVVSEDRPFELPERIARLDPELVDQRPSRPLVDGERVRLPSRAIEREHQLSAKPLPKRVLGDQALELGDELAMAAEPEIGVDPILECRDSKLLEPDDLRVSERLPGEVGERRPTPERECRPQGVGRTSGVARPERRPPLLAETSELEEVDGFRVDDEPVPRRRRLERAFGQELSQLRDVDLDRVAGRVGRVLPPEPIDEAIARDDVICLQEQGGEQRAPLLSPERDRCSVAAHREGTEEAELWTSRGHRWVLARFQRSFSWSSAGGVRILP